MTVGNLPDRYWCFCQRCKTGAVEMKMHVVVGGPPPKESTSMVRPSDERALLALEHHERDQLTAMLARKSMDWMYFGSTPITYSLSRQRLIIHTPSGAMGRDATERSDTKWLTYDRQPFLRASLMHPDVLLVEDTFSQYKVQYALDRLGMQVAVICTLGTAIHDSLMLWLMQHAKRVWSFYDGDSAGWKGALANAKRLRAVGLQGPGDVLAACAPMDKDPKDLQLKEITDHVRRLCAC